MLKRTLAISFALLLLSVPLRAQGLPPAVAWNSFLSLPAITPTEGNLQGAQVFSGQTPGGAYYKISMPASWNGDLVFWNHGFSLEEPNADVDLGPLAALQLAQGFAVAASSYRQAGWALFYTRQDLEELYQVFVAQFGAPARVILYGASMGGLVTAQALEQADLGNVVGALPMCGVLAGSRNWDGILDLRLAYDVIAADTPAAAIPGAAEGLPKDSAFTDADLATAVNAATGILLPPAFRSARQKANLAQILQFSGIPATFLLLDMRFATFALSDLVHDETKLGGRIGAGNQGVVYGDDEIDANILRVSPDPLASRRLRRYFIPTGKVGDAKIVAIHTDKDGLVLVENESEYAALVPSANLTTAVVVETIPTHCGFSATETAAAWTSLLDWVNGGPQPTVSDLQQSCQEQPPEYVGPCRYDPTFVIPDLDERIRPRSAPQVLFLPEMLAGAPHQ